MRRWLKYSLRALSLLCFLIAIERPAKADPVTAITSGVQLGGGILSGIFGHSAAKKAAAIQKQSAIDAARRTDETTQSVNGDLIGAGNATALQLRQAAGEATARNDEGTINANKLLDPYRNAGDESIETLRAGLTPGGDFNKTPGMADIQIDPGFEFRRAQAQKALEGSAAARGGVMAGGGRDVLALNSNLASQEFQNAFERFRNTTKDRFDRLSTVSKYGQDAAGTQGTNLIKGAQYGGDLNYKSAFDAGKINLGAAEEAGQNSLQGTRDVNELMTGGANAEAAGLVQGSNQLWSGINGGISGAASTIGLHNLLKNPNGGAYDPRTGRVRLSGYGYGGR